MFKVKDLLYKFCNFIQITLVFRGKRFGKLVKSQTIKLIEFTSYMVSACQLLHISLSVQLNMVEKPSKCRLTELGLKARQSTV